MSVKDDYDVSIIVPVYNAESYLQECIDSILNQTKQNIEIVLVNDGSTDRSREIIMRNAEQYDNITFIDQENKGVCIARNAGIAAAKGEYIGWLDSDDMLKPNAIETLYDKMKKENADYGYYNICFFPQSVSTKKPWYKEYKGQRDWNFIERNSQCTNSLTKKELLKKVNIQYWFEQFSEYGWIMVLLFAERIVSLSEEMYIYRVGHNSSSGGSFIGKVPKFKKAVAMTKRLPEMITGTEYDPELMPYFEYRYIYTLILLMIVSAINSDKSNYCKARTELLKIHYKRNEFTKTILDHNHGKLKSFVLRDILPVGYWIARCIVVAEFR